MENTKNKKLQIKFKQTKENFFNFSSFYSNWRKFDIAKKISMKLILLNELNGTIFKKLQTFAAWPLFSAVAFLFYFVAVYFYLFYLFIFIILKSVHYYCLLSLPLLIIIFNHCVYKH